MQAENDLRKLLAIPANYKVLFLQGALQHASAFCGPLWLLDVNAAWSLRGLCTLASVPQPLS